MTPQVQDSSSPKALWLGRILSGLAALFLTFDTAMKLLQVPEAIKGTIALGYSPAIVFPLGVVCAVFLALYLWPRTAILGAVLWTAYLGGAVATHVRMGNPTFTHVLSPVYVAIILWLGLWLRDQRLRATLS